jgi:hypothetical protein
MGSYPGLKALPRSQCIGTNLPVYGFPRRTLVGNLVSRGNALGSPPRFRSCIRHRPCLPCLATKLGNTRVEAKNFVLDLGALRTNGANSATGYQIKVVGSFCGERRRGPWFQRVWQARASRTVSWASCWTTWRATVLSGGLTTSPVTSKTLPATR